MNRLGDFDRYVYSHLPVTKYTNDPGALIAIVGLFTSFIMLIK